MNIIMDYLKTWGLYQCFQGIDDEMIASDCRNDFFALQPNGKVFHCILVQGDIITLEYGEKRFRVNSKLYKVVREPSYKIGDTVRIIEKTLIGRITDINWHIRDDAPFYFVEIDGKKKRKRYLDSDLKKVK